MPLSAFGDGLVVDEQLDVAVVLVGREVGAVAVVDEFAVLDPPVLGEDVASRSLARGPFVGRELGQPRGLDALAPVPAGQVLAVEDRDEASGRGLREGRRGEQAGREAGGQREHQGESSCHDNSGAR